MNTSTPEHIEAAAEWWAQRLVDGRNSGLSPEERRDPANDSYQFAEMLMTIAKPSVTSEQVAAFKAALIQALSGDSYGARRGVLATDYGPDTMLADALVRAGIPVENALPIKTIMWIKADAVSVRYGYGADLQTIYRRSIGEAQDAPTPAPAVHTK